MSVPGQGLSLSQGNKWDLNAIPTEDAEVVEVDMSVPAHGHDIVLSQGNKWDLNTIPSENTGICTYICIWNVRMYVLIRCMYVRTHTHDVHTYTHVPVL